MKKILCILLVLCCISGYCITVGAENPRILVGAGESSLISTKMFSAASSDNYVVMPDDAKTVAQRFTISNDKLLGKVAVRCHSWGNNLGTITFDLYKWDTNYLTTVKATPIQSKTFVDFPDTVLLEMPLDKIDLNGDFLLVLTHGGDILGPWTGLSSSGQMFIDGEPAAPGRSVELTVYTADKPGPSEIFKNIPQNAYSPLNLKDYSESTAHSVNDRGWNETVYPSLYVANGLGYYAYTVDFGDTSPKGVKIKMCIDNSGTEWIQLISDDLLTGEVLCSIPSGTKPDKADIEITAKIDTELTGVHTVYVVLEIAQNSALSSLEFLKETPADNEFEKLVKEYGGENDYAYTDVYSDTWTATDMLGRKLADHSGTGDYNPDKQVGMFYWTWHGGRTYKSNRITVNQNVIDLYNGDESEIKNNSSYPGWENIGVWNESVYGIYSSYDKWVIRKQLELLSAAGVDSLFFDCTNGTSIFTLGYRAVAETMNDMHKEGIKTPGFAFMLPFTDISFNTTDLENLYNELYSVGLYSDSWYYFEGKPVIMGYPDGLSIPTGVEDIDAQHKEILEFFTFRPGQPSYFKGPQRDDQWPWLEVYPQKSYGKSDKYGCEAVSVGVAMNATTSGITAMNGENVLGRSYTYKNGFTKLSDTSSYYGYNFLEQWEKAHELDPEFVFVTGWNEWTADRYDSWQGVTFASPDTYSDEYSRDIEPTKGKFKDTYYYLLANEIRKFKGVRPAPAASEPKTINLDGDFTQWIDVSPDFIGIKGGTEPRNSYLNGTGTHTPVTNNTGRNDIILSKVARDSENLYFYVKTAEKLSPYTVSAWMQLLINTDRTYKTGWEGYDYILNRVSPTATTATLEKWSGKYNERDWEWEAVAEVSYKLSDNEMMIAIPRSVLGIGETVDIEFKWNDNMQIHGDIMDFYSNGDTAPIGRYAYHYYEGIPKKTADEPVDPANLLSHKTAKFIVMAIGKNYAFKFGNRVKIDELSDVTSPMIINDKTMVPVRFLSESIGAKVDWNDSDKTVQISRNGKRIFLTLNSAEMRIEKKRFTLQSPATEIENRIYVPLRDIVEALDITCNWVDPGVIVLGDEVDFSMLFANNGLIETFEVYGMQYQ